MKTNRPEVEVPVTADVIRTMLSRVTTRDDKLDKPLVNVAALTLDPADSDNADTRSLLPDGIMLVSAILPRMLRDRTTFRGTTNTAIPHSRQPNNNSNNNN